MDTPSDQADGMKGSSALCQVAVPVPIRRGQMQIYDYVAGPAANCAVGSIVKAPLAGREIWGVVVGHDQKACLLYTSPSPRDLSTYRMPSSA